MVAVARRRPTAISTPSSAIIAGSVATMTRRLDPEAARDVLMANLDHPRWDDVAERCLSCTNCTLVCPTCFCSAVEDVTSLDGDRAERVQRWDSCFTLGHSSLHGAGSVRGDTRVALPPVADPQAVDLVGPVRRVRLRRLRSLHRLVPGRRSISPQRSRRSRRGGRAMKTTTIRDLLAAQPVLRDLEADDLDLMAGCGHNEVFEAGRLPGPGGRAGRPLLRRPRRARSRSRCTRRPGRW